MRVLLELRPALAGHAGIPQETRLLFRGLAQVPGVTLDGLIQTGDRLLSRGLPADEARSQRWSEDRRVDRLSRLVVSIVAESPSGRPASVWRLVQIGVETLRAVVGSQFGWPVRLSRFDAARFADFVWGAMFSKTLAPDDLASVGQAAYRIMRLPWSAAHAAAAFSNGFGKALFPRIDTGGYDVFVAETPYPGRISSGTALVVRYHDAFPVLMPHTIFERERHRRAHLLALRRNVEDGAWFACVSESTRRDLVSLFPKAEARSVTIPNTVSHHYFPEQATAEQIFDILQARGDSRQLARFTEWPRRIQGAPLQRAPLGSADYLLMVSTIEPRKNHLGLLAAWEQLRAHGFPELRLLFVGAMGWGHEPVIDRLAPWMQRGLADLLDEVPASELRLLYRYARVTVCPSFGEGFGFSGVEAMRCGGVVAASDLPVHREVYADAVEYFNPYSVDDMAASIRRLLAPEAESRRVALAAAGTEVARRYLPANVLPRWSSFLERLTESRPTALSAGC